MSAEELDAAAARIQGAATAAITGGKEAELDAAAALIQSAAGGGGTDESALDAAAALIQAAAGGGGYTDETSVITAAPVPRALPTTKQAKDYVAATLTPTLTAGLVALCRAKPAEPAAFLAQYLIEHNPAGGKAKA